MASDVHTGMMSTSPQGRCGGGSNSSSTTNLVRLLREAEEGKGLEIDYSDALGEALGEKYDFGENVPKAMRRQQKGTRTSLTLLGKVPSLGRKRCGIQRVVLRSTRTFCSTPAPPLRGCSARKNTLQQWCTSSFNSGLRGTSSLLHIHARQYC